MNMMTGKHNSQFQFCFEQHKARPNHPIRQLVSDALLDPQEGWFMDLFIPDEQNPSMTKATANAGLLVTTKKGFKGRTFNRDELINGKQPVYSLDGKTKLLCDPEALTVYGFID